MEFAPMELNGLTGKYATLPFRLGGVTGHISEIRRVYYRLNNV